MNFGSWNFLAGSSARDPRREQDGCRSTPAGTVRVVSRVESGATLGNANSMISMPAMRASVLFWPEFLGIAQCPRVSEVPPRWGGGAKFAGHRWRRDGVRKVLTASVWLTVAMVIILAFQNLEPTEVEFFFWKLELRLPLIIALAWILGAVTVKPLFRLLWPGQNKDGQKSSDSGAATSGGGFSSGTANSPAKKTPQTPASGGSH